MTYIAGFICALVLAALVVIWITYCMFFKEKHKSEVYQYGVSDLRRKNYEVAQEHEQKQKKEIVTGIIMLPSRNKQKEDRSYERRPDYPESTIVQPRTDKLVEIFNDSTLEADAHKCVDFNLDPTVPYHSDV